MGEELGTPGSVLNGAEALLKRASPSPQLDAELLLASVLKQPRTYVLAHRADPLPARATRNFTSLVRRRAEGIPLPYLTRTKEFYGRTFVVTPAVLIPRPETEAVAEEALRILGTTSELRTVVADIGTGSGVLAVTIAADAPRARVVAADFSAAALEIARRNARRHKVARRITFIESDLLTEIPPELAPHLMVANLPYVPTDELKHANEKPETRGLTFEPQRALDGGPDGLHVIRRFFAQILRLNTQRSPLLTRLQALVLEHSPPQRRAVTELAHKALPALRPREAAPMVTTWTRA